jgi:hypothetical protein
MFEIACENAVRKLLVLSEILKDWGKNPGLVPQPALT